MRNLIITLLATSSVDSLNPIGITQQFILQGMVKKPRHIWYFIVTTAVVNIIFGYLVYYGVLALIDRFFGAVMERYDREVYSLEILLGVVTLVLGAVFFIRKLLRERRENGGEEETPDLNEDRARSKFKHVTPITLINIGVISTASELTSALPYFAFLSVLVTYHLSFPVLTLVFICYNIIYIAPFAILYFVYIISKKQFDRVYVFFRTRFRKYLGYCIPALLLVVGAAVIYNGCVNLLGVL